MLCKDENSFVESESKINIFSILERNLRKKYSTSEGQPKILESSLSKETPENFSLKKKINLAVVCGLLSDYLDEIKDNVNKEILGKFLSNEEILNTNYFEELLISDKGRMIGYCNDYFSSDSTLVMKDFLESNFVIVRYYSFLKPK